MVVVTVRGAALALAATGVLVGCGRSELEPGPVDTGGASAFAEGGRTGAGAGGGTGGAPSGAGADSGANGGGRGGSGGGTDGGGAGFAGRGAGLAGSSGDTGGAGGSLAGGGMGATDDLPVVCQPSLTPAFDGPPGTLTFASADSGVLFDFNHDGKLDLVTGDRGGNVSVYLGLGDGSLADRVTYLTGLNQTGAPDLDVPCLVTAGDLDLDGNLDLIASSSAGASISVLLGRRDGTFSPPTNYGTGDDMPVVATAVGDLNGDGWPDVMVAKTDGIEPSAVNMLVGTGDGSLGVTVGIQNGGTVRGIALGDFNGDKRLDAALLEQSVVTVLVAVGGGLFESLGDLELQGSTPASLEVDDLNGDENLDLIATMECDRVADPTQVSVFLGTGAGTFRPDASYHASICGGGKAALGDLNRDGSPDVATSADTALLGRGDGTFAPEVASSQTVGGTLLGLGDFDGDGIPDEATSAAGIGGSEWILVRHGNGDGTFGPIHDFATASGAWALVLADFDHDGALDVAALNGQTDDAVSVLLGDGKGGLSAPANYGTSAYPRALGLLIDRTDQAALVTTNDIPSVDVLTGDGHGKFAAPSEFMVGPGPTAPLIGDLDGNLWPDIVTLNGSGRSVSVLLADGKGSFLRLADRPLAQVPAGGVLADVNGDTKLDLVVVNPDISTVSVLAGEGSDGEGVFDAPRDFATGDSPSQVVAGDLDEDGAPDLVTANAHSFSVLLGLGGASFAPHRDYAVAPEAMALADVNLDGHLDLVVSSNGLGIMLGKGDGTFSCIEEYAQSTQTSALAVGDLNGDGRPDLATTGYRGVSVLLNRPR